MDNKIVIDALPYIDSSVFGSISKDSIEEMINKEMNSIDKSVIDEKIKEAYPSLNIKSSTDAICDVAAPLKNSIDVPPPNKYYNDKEWEKKFKELNYTIEAKQIDNFNLELINEHASATWDGYMTKSMDHLAQFKQERDAIQNGILFLNKKRKFNQMLYQKELDSLDRKINSTLAQIRLIEAELKDE